MTIRPSGIIVPPKRPKFNCRYPLDDRLDEPLMNLNQRLYRTLQSFLGGKIIISQPLLGSRLQAHRQAVPPQRPRSRFFTGAETDALVAATPKLAA